MLVGDFNELENLAKNKGGNFPVLRRTERLTSFLSSIRAESVTVNDNIFTWKKKDIMGHGYLKD